VIETVPQSSSAVATPNSSSNVAVQVLVVAETSGGTLSVGGVVSVPFTVIVWVQDADWPSLPVAVHSIVVTPTGKGLLNSAWLLYARLSLRLPSIVALPEFEVAVPGSTGAGSHPVGELTVWFGGQLMDNVDDPLTRIVCWQLALRPVGCASTSCGSRSYSVATQVITVVPIGYDPVKASPSSRLPVTNTLVPVDVGVPTFEELWLGSGTYAWLSPAFAVTVILLGQVIVGAAESMTVTVKLQNPPPVEELLVTVVVPIGKNEPEAGVLVTVPHVPKASGAV
jgi:hypothetical protein